MSAASGVSKQATAMAAAACWLLVRSLRRSSGSGKALLWPMAALAILFRVRHFTRPVEKHQVPVNAPRAHGIDHQNPHPFHS